MVEAATVAPFRGRLPRPIEGEAWSLARVLPRLAIEARQVSRHLALGMHGRRRAGPGEAFWQFRPFSDGESAGAIDWRRSARDGRLYVREREWENASAHWIWIDLSPSMLFASGLARCPKRDRAIVLGLALADLLVRGGERVGLLGLTPPLATRSIIDRLAEALMHARNPDSEFPAGQSIGRRERAILIGDCILSARDFEIGLAGIAARGGTGTVVAIRDPAESLFPFAGETEFIGTEGGERWRVGDAAGVAARYRERIDAHLAELRRIAMRQRFTMQLHLTSRGAGEGLLALSGYVGSAPPDENGR